MACDIHSFSLKCIHSIIRTIILTWLPSLLNKQSVELYKTGVFSHVATDIFLEWCKLMWLLKQNCLVYTYSVIRRLGYLGGHLYVVLAIISKSYFLFWIPRVFRDLWTSSRLAQTLSPWQRCFQRMEILNLSPQEKKGTLVVFHRNKRTVT